MQFPPRIDTEVAIQMLRFRRYFVSLGASARLAHTLSERDGHMRRSVSPHALTTLDILDVICNEPSSETWQCLSSTRLVLPERMS